MPRPKKLHTLCVQLMRDKTLAAAKQIVADAICAKLEAQGISAETFPAEQYVDHLASGNKRDFQWEAGPDTTIAFTPEEVAAITEEVDGVLSLRRHQTQVTAVLESAAAALLKDHIKKGGDLRATEGAELHGFRERLHMHWGKALDLYRIMLRTSYDLFSDMARALRNSRSTRNFFLRDALIGIHARALRTGRAVLVLLEHGMADEAYTRWRTLYELSTVAHFLAEHGDEAARMYREHEVVANKQRIDNSLEWNSPLGTTDERRDVERDYNNLIQKYGESFKRPYGWKSRFLVSVKNPRFVDLERAVRGKQLVPPYKESSLQVHGGRAGLLGLGTLDGLLVTTAYSNAGLDIPLMHSSLAIMQITITTLFRNPARDVVIMKMLMLLDEKIHAEARIAATKLEQNHRARKSR